MFFLGRENGELLLRMRERERETFLSWAPPRWFTALGKASFFLTEETGGFCHSVIFFLRGRERRGDEERKLWPLLRQTACVCVWECVFPRVALAAASSLDSPLLCRVARSSCQEGGDTEHASKKWHLLRNFKPSFKIYSQQKWHFFPF